MTSRNYCFTINNPTTDNLVFPEQVKYGIYQPETGENGTPHLQGYMELDNGYRIAALKKWGGDWARAHYEPRGGTREQAREYCTPEHIEKNGKTKAENGGVRGPYVEHGSFKTEQGKRTDLLGATNLASKTKSLKRVAEEYPTEFVRHAKGFEKLIEVLGPEPRDFKTQVYVFYGSPGAGKSRMATRLSGDQAFYLTRGIGGAVWWDGYEGHKDVIIDEFYGWLGYDFMLRLLDRYPMRVQVKGGTREFVSKRIFITSNKPWNEWYKFSDNPNMVSGTLERRIDYIVFFEVDQEPIVEKEP